MFSAALRMIVKNSLNTVRYYFVSDKTFNVLRYKKVFGKKPDLVNPKTFSEKLLYLKMHYRNLLENVCADKFEVQNYVKQCGYEGILKKNYLVCNTVDELNFDSLPDRFFIQCSHTQGSNYIVDKSNIEKFEQIKKEYRHVLHRKHHMVLRENCYKYLTPRIICSEYLEEEGRHGLTDYKFYCFGGVPKYFMVSYGEFEHNVKNHKFDMDWNSIDYLFKTKEAVSSNEIEKPANFDEMVEIVTKLAAPFPHVRVDLYNISGRIVFGEMTFYSAGGFVKVHSKEMDLTIGSWIDLEKYREYLV